MWSDKEVKSATGSAVSLEAEIEAYIRAQAEARMPRVRFVRTHSDAKLPTRGTDGAVGWDVYSVEDVTLQPGETTLVDTGWRIAVQEGYEVQVRPRSGLALNKNVTVLNTPGTIDPDYRGKLGVILVCLNQGYDFFPAKREEIRKGDRIAQLVVAPVTRAAMIEVESFDDTTARGESGYGSTGS